MLARATYLVLFLGFSSPAFAEAPAEGEVGKLMREGLEAHARLPSTAAAFPLSEAVAPPEHRERRPNPGREVGERAAGAATAHGVPTADRAVDAARQRIQHVAPMLQDRLRGETAAGQARGAEEKRKAASAPDVHRRPVRP
jgi:hypothetical protein